jgi:hypothetical protein
MANKLNVSTEYKLILTSMFSPSIAFFVGYKLLNQKLLFLLGISSLFLYGVLFSQHMWITVLKLNICYTGFYYVGCYPYVINKVGLLAVKVLMSLAVLVSPIFVQSVIPSTIVDFMFSGILIASGLILIWAGKRPSNLMLLNTHC